MITQNTGFSKWGFGILHIKREKQDNNTAKCNIEKDDDKNVNG